MSKKCIVNIKRITIKIEDKDMGKYFGTDGVRGVANTELTPEFTLKLC